MDERTPEEEARTLRRDERRQRNKVDRKARRSAARLTAKAEREPEPQPDSQPHPVPSAAVDIEERFREERQRRQDDRKTQRRAARRAARQVPEPLPEVVTEPAPPPPPAAVELEHRRLRRQWAVPVTQPMVLISQVPRSGGTLLGRLFDSHPACFTHPLELRWGRPAKEDWPSFIPDETLAPRDAYDLLSEKWPEKFAAQGGYSKYTRHIRAASPSAVALAPFVYDSELAFELFVDAYRREGATSRRSVLNAYLTAFFNGWLDYQNLYAGPKQWVVCFLPTIVTIPDSIDRFFTDYPDGRLVTIVRDPGSWWASYSAYRTDVTVELSEGIALWTASTEASLAAQRTHGDRVTILLFEDLVLQTEQTMRAISDRLGLPFDPVLLRPSFNGLPILSHSSFRLSIDIDADTTLRHRTLPREEQAVIERVATPLYDEVARHVRQRRSSFSM